ncbi:hypothetical protein CHLRE_14g623576v5 [Chlamydomonas reinhardtii]|uniref:Uncharacterized protein n=1 Tax=Chlamydomonas reinhardtii TaxID=3055 RepID=A0A2K3CY87_CHLRE|nr:uncharacterized protein CHLRE_14g623576v5 [Chlamydomonas reinhardtii]PNW73219.1 hypothetical protein CHLRE_14g623576v5 [Chlamydomonas reinhardtii]
MLRQCVVNFSLGVREGPRHSPNLVVTSFQLTGRARAWFAVRMIKQHTLYSLIPHA